MTTQTNTPEVLTSDEAADLLRITPETIRRMVRRGDLSAQRIGGRIRITRASLQAWLANTSTSNT